jgi:hypothetical protein
MSDLSPLCATKRRPVPETLAEQLLHFALAAKRCKLRTRLKA